MKSIACPTLPVTTMLIEYHYDDSAKGLLNIMPAILTKFGKCFSSRLFRENL